MSPFPGMTYETLEAHQREVRAYELSALRAENVLLRRQRPSAQAVAETDAVVPVIGGGTTLRGKILWLLENEGPRTWEELVARMGQHFNKSNLSLHPKIEAEQLPHSTVKRWRAKVAATLCAVVCLMVGQGEARGEGREAIGAAIPMPTMLVVATKPQWLTFTTATPTNAVYLGPVRLGFTNRVEVATNRIAYVPGVHYGIQTMVDGKEVGAMAFWPQIPIGEIRLRERGQTNYTVLEAYTNAPAQPQRLWDVLNVITRYQ